MVRETTLGQLLIERALPTSMRGKKRVLDSAGVKELFQELADNHPEQYREVGKALSDVGRHAATESGGMSVGVNHLLQPDITRTIRRRVQAQLQSIYAEDLPEAEKQAKVIAVSKAAQTELSKAVYQHAMDTKNPIGLQAKTGVRGNAANVNSLLGADMLYMDNTGKEIPLPVLHNYSEGLTPAEYFAGAFGARQGVYAVKRSTADSGYYGKQLNQIAHRLLVSAKDSEDYNPETLQGLPVDTDDQYNAGALLAHDVGGYKRNQLLTPRILKELKAAGHDQILVRSPIVGGPKDGGVYAYDTGVRERNGGLSPIGDYVGLAGAQALSEVVTQSALSAKHQGGVVGSTAGGLSGFKAFNNLIQVPKVFPGGATHAQLDGRVMGIKPAPQGGNYVTVDSTEHHVPQDVALKVKLHDMVEAGDVLSDGLPNPGELVKHKGVGDGRKHFVQIMADVAKRSGTRADRRNIELVARGLINHVRLTDEYEDGVPGETYPYQFLEATWQPREGHTASTPDSAKGQYLERPALHYTVGTKIRPSVIANLNKFGVKQVYTHKDPPPFEPEMIRAMASVSEDKDWMTNMLGSYQKTSLLDAVHRGRTADTAGTSYVPAMAQGQPFGIQGASKGWDPKAPQMDAPDVTAVDKPIKPIGTASKSLLDDDGFDD